MLVIEMQQLRSKATHLAAKTHSVHANDKSSHRPCRRDDIASSLELRDRIVEEQAIALLRSSPYLPIRSLRCEVGKRVLILRGRVPSFYMKQMSQAVLRNLLAGGLRIDNQVEVEWTSLG
jgi:hypothetical protein